MVSVVPGKRTAEKVVTLVRDFQQRTASRPMNLMTSDEYPAYKRAILEVYGEEVRPPRTGKAGRPKAAYKALVQNFNCIQDIEKLRCVIHNIW